MQPDAAAGAPFPLPKAAVLVREDRKDAPAYSENPDAPKIVSWEQMKDKLVQLHALRASLEAVVAKRERMHRKISTHFQKESKQLGRSELLEDLRLRVHEMQLEVKSAKSHVEKEKKKASEYCRSLQPRIQNMEIAFNSLTSAKFRLQEANNLLQGSNGTGKLEKLQRALGWRRQRMTNQVAAIYSISSIQSSASSKSQDKMASSSSSSSSSSAASLSSLFYDTSFFTRKDEGAAKPIVCIPETLSEKHMLEITKLPLPSVAIKVEEISDKSQIQTLSSALGFAAHAVCLISQYLDVPLKYPIEYYASKSFVWDINPPSELQSQITESQIHVLKYRPRLKGIRFPLFIEAQDGARFSYAIFLLNKNLEQLLSGLGLNWVGPRHTLPNLERLYSAIRKGGGHYISG